MNVKVCASCSEENDVSRIYCQNCGSRLPEELTPASKAAVAAAGESVQSARSAPALPVSRRSQPIKPTRDGAPSLLGVLVPQIFYTAVMAAILACVVQMARQPDGIPSAVPVNAAAAQKTFSTMQDCANSAQSGSWTVNEAAINEFIISTVQMRSSGSSSMFQAEFRRAFLVLRAGAASYFVEQSVLGGALFFQLQFEPEAVSGQLQPRVTGAAIGRLPIHPSLVAAIMPFFRPSLSGLDQATALLQKAGGATITPTEVVIQWPGSVSTTP